MAALLARGGSSLVQAVELPIANVAAHAGGREPAPEKRASRGQGDVLLSTIEQLSHLCRLDDVLAVVGRGARALTGAEGVGFVLERPRGMAPWIDEDGGAPTFYGAGFPATEVLVRWAVERRGRIAVEDLRADPRIQPELSRAAQARGFAMVPIRASDPVGALLVYWGSPHTATPRELNRLEALAGATALAVVNAELLDAAQRALRLRDDFLVAASHELRTPLTPLTLQLERLSRSLRRGEVPNDQVRDGLGRAQAYSDRLRRLVDDLLDTVALSQGELTLSPQRVDLVATAAAAIGRVQKAALCQRCDRTGSALTGEIRLQADGPVIGCWDPMRMEQAIRCLLGNAVRFGQRQPIVVSVDADETTARIAVTDHGVGIDEQDQMRIFEKFARASRGRPVSGLGLGLYCVRQIVEASGGRVRVASALGQGSTFTIELPRKLAGSAHREEPPREVATRRACP